MNVLYLGHYRENSSIGYSSKRYIHAINDIDYINLSVRPLYLQKNVSSNIPPHILTCEQNRSDYYDMVIQDTFPEYYEYNGSFGKNICMPKIISRNLQHTGWIDKINMMDEVWVNSYFAEKSLRESGVDKLIKVIPEPFDLNIETSEKNESDKEFNFYSSAGCSFNVFYHSYNACPKSWKIWWPRSHHFPSISLRLCSNSVG